MIFRREENIFDLFPDVIVHPVNCTGLSHDLLSKQLKKTAPEYFREYARACLRKKLTPGTASLYEQNALFGTRFIITVTIKEHWQEKLRPDTTKKALAAMSILCDSIQAATLAIPILHGPPEGWLENELRKLFDSKIHCYLNEVYFFEAEAE